MPQLVAVLASVLKPVDDTRLFEKLGRTIGQTYKYQVNIIGFQSKNNPVHPEVIFHPIYNFTRYSMARLWAPLKFLIHLRKLSPGLLVIASPELIPAACIYKLFHPTELWYDLQENYSRNVSTQPSYPPWSKPLLLFYLWILKQLCYPMVDHFLLAEEGYRAELNLPLNKSTVLANKVWHNPDRLKAVSKSTKFFVYTGTISREHGVMEAVELIKAFHTFDPSVNMKIAGQCRDKNLYKELLEISDRFSFMELDAGEDPLPHAYLLDIIATADYGLVSHRPIGSFENCIPTRIYEFLAAELPMILQAHPLWESVTEPYPGAVVIDFRKADPYHTWQQLQQTEFYLQKPGKEILWESEAPKLVKLLEAID